MRRRMTIAKFVCLGIMLLALPLAAAPRMEISPDAFDFGYAPQQSRLTHVFWVYSTGDDTLKILKVTPGCGCTRAPLDKDVLLPGDSSRLEIIFSSGSFTNKVVKTPTIETNTGSGPDQVQIKAHVLISPDSTYPVTITPYKLDLSQFTDKVRDRIDFSLKNVSDQEVKITLVDYPDDLFTVDLPQTIGAGKEAKATLKLTKPAIDESFEKSMTIQLDDNRQTRFTIPVVRTVRTLGDK